MKPPSAPRAATVPFLGTLGLGALLLSALPAVAGPSGAPPLPAAGDVPGPPPLLGACVATRGAAVPERVALTPTSRAPAAAGWMELVMPASPFGVTVAGDGRTVYDVTVAATSLRRREGRHYVVWAATPELDRVRRLGVLDAEGRTAGRVEWNKFLVFVTEEPAPDGDRWTGPILLTGLSPSGLLHTMRGHGIFEAHGVGC